MGQQQLLLIVLGVIIVGIAVAVGINMFSSSAIDANRDAVTSDLTNLGSKAQQYFKKPTTMGGGGNDFQNFTLGVLDRSNTNGEFRVATAVPATLVISAPVAAVANYSIATSQRTIYVVGYGTEKGRDDTNLVMAYATVDATSIASTILN
jgi:Tfp pilus assembly protein PilE